MSIKFHRNVATIDTVIVKDTGKLSMAPKFR